MDELQWLRGMAAAAAVGIIVLGGLCWRTLRQLHQRDQMQARLLTRIERQKNLFRQVFDAAPLGLMVEDRHGEITHFNTALTRLLGLEPHAMAPLAISVEHLVADSEKRQALAAFRETLEARPAQLHQWEVPIKTMRGELRWVQLSAQSLVCERDGRFEGIVWLMEDITAARRDRKALEAMSYQDMLTGLLNRRAFMKAWEEERARAERYGFPLSLIVMDIDLFKQVNDRYGHAAGDEVLQWFARQCRRHLRRTDVVARLGGEEFVVLLPHTAGSVAHKVAEHLRAYFAGHVCPLKSGRVIRITFSGGVAEWQKGEDFDALFQRADTALYQAKAQGRNRVIAWSPELETKADETRRPAPGTG